MIGMAGLLLDVGEPASRDIFSSNPRPPLGSRMWKYQLHLPRRGDAEKFPHIPEEVLDVIRSHHERLDGSGIIPRS